VVTGNAFSRSAVGGSRADGWPGAAGTAALRLCKGPKGGMAVRRARTPTTTRLAALYRADGQIPGAARTTCSIGGVFAQRAAASEAVVIMHACWLRTTRRAAMPAAAARCAQLE